MTPSEILMKHEDANEYHFHEVDRKWIIEAMEEYATISKRETVDKEKSVIPINLYTEEQVLNMLRSFHNLEMNVQLCMLKLKPIELPSDEEIKIASPYVPQDASMDFWANKEGFIDGAKWMKEQILNQNE